MFVQQRSIAVYFSMSRYDRVLKKSQAGGWEQVFGDLEQTRQDCDQLRGCLEQYGIKSAD